MALSNIFREPRREITETVVGAIMPVGSLLVLYLWASAEYAAGNKVCTDCGRTGNIIIFMIVVGFLLLLGLGLLILSALAIHSLGEALCQSLENRGVRLRPKQRY